MWRSFLGSTADIGPPAGSTPNLGSDNDTGSAASIGSDTGCAATVLVYMCIMYGVCKRKKNQSP